MSSLSRQSADAFDVHDLRDASGGVLFSEVELQRLDAQVPMLKRVARSAVRRLRGKSAEREWSEMQGRWILFDHPSGVGFWLRVGDSVAHGIIRSASTTDDRATRFILSRLTKGGTLLDVGANAGWFSLRAAAQYRELGGGRVIAFEPQAAVHEHLVKSVQHNRFEDIVEVHQIAVGDRTEDVWMIDAGANSGGSYVSWSKPSRPGDRVGMRRFDDLKIDTGRVDCIKLDVEGSEPLFLRGAAKLIAEQKPPIYCEIGDRKLRIVADTTGADLVRTVEGLGYRSSILLSDSSLTPLKRQHLEKSASGIINVVFEPVGRPPQAT